MATETPPAATGTAAPETPATPVDPRAAALAVLNGGQPDATPKAASAPAVAAAEGTTPSTASPPSSGEPAATAKAPAEGEQQKDRLSAGYARLAREKASLLEQRKALEAEATAYRGWKANADKVKADPASVLELHGLTLEQVAAAYLAREAGQPAPSPEDRIAALEAEKAARLKSEEDARKKVEDETKAATIRQARETGLAVVREQLTADAFPTVVALGEHEQVFEALGQYVVRHNIPADQITTDLLKLVAAGVEKALADDIGGVIEKVPHIAKRAPTPSTTQSATGQPTASGAQGTSATSLASSEVSGAPAPQPGRRYTNAELQKMALAHFGPSN